MARPKRRQPLPRPEQWVFAWLPLPSYLLGCCIICNDCKAAKTLFMQNTRNFTYISNYHLLCEGVLVTSQAHNETEAVNCRICNDAGMQTTSIHNVELLLGHKGILVEAGVHDKTANQLRELLHQLSCTPCTSHAQHWLCLCACVQSCSRRINFGCCTCCCISSKAMANWKPVLQLWHQRCSCGSSCESCCGVGYVQTPPTVKAEGVTYMVRIGGGLHCTAAAALPEALLPSAGVTDCLACNLSCIYTSALQRR